MFSACAAQITDRGLVKLIEGARMLKIIEANQASLSDKVRSKIVVLVRSEITEADFGASQKLCITGPGLEQN